VGGSAWAAAFGDRPPAVIHSFSGPVDYARAVIDLGLAVSFSGLVFRAGEEPSAEVARLVPADRVLVETDSPFLAPPGAPRSRNEPEWVRVTGAWLAERRATSPETLGTTLVEAYDRTFPRTRAAAR
jgi:TatD DNase family protein